MAKPAITAFNKIKETYPDAVISARNKNSITADVGTHKKVLVSSIDSMHYDDGGWQEIDTTWNPTTGAWQYEMTTAPYQAFARDTFNAGVLVEYHTRVGEWVNFQPLALNWRDENNSQQQISTPQTVTTQVTEDLLSWPQAYGPGRHFEWRANPSRLQKVIKIDAATDLPTPTVGGSVIELETTFVFNYDTSVTAFVDGVAWDRNSTVSTGDNIEFRNAGGDVLWAFIAPKAWDSVGNETTGVLSFYKVGNNLHVAVRIPKSFVDASVFPLFLDPTITPSVIASGDDVRVDSAGGFASDTTYLQVGYDTGISASVSSSARFQPTIPNSATIDNATISFTSAFTESPDAFAVMTTRLTCHADDNSTQITSKSDFDSRTRTTHVGWLPGIWSEGTVYTSPSFATGVQEVVNRSGWADTNHLTVFWDDAGSNQINGNYRRPASFDNTTYAAPLLTVEYTAGTPVILTPNLDGTTTGFENESSATTNLYQSIDEVTADGDTTFIKNSGAANASAFFDLTDTPSDFDSMNTISLDIDIRKE